MVWHQEIHPALHSTRDIGSGKLMAAILENGAVCELHTLLTMSSRSFVTPTPQRLILVMQTNVVIRLPPTRKPEPFFGLCCSTTADREGQVCASRQGLGRRGVCYVKGMPNITWIVCFQVLSQTVTHFLREASSVSNTAPPHTLHKIDAGVDCR